MELQFSPTPAARARGPNVVWMLAVLIAVVLGAAALASAHAKDSRDFVAKHRTVLATHAL